jgi:hypothetical protein
MLRGEGGQAMVEAALVLPSFVLLLLGAVQLAQLQQARILADSAAFAAARAGIVMNGDPGKMREAATLALLPAFAPADSLGALGKGLLRFQAEEALLKPFGLQRLQIEIHNPVAADFARFGRHLDGKELDFDDVRPGATEATLLSLRLRYLFELEVPFANRIVHAAWLALRARAGDGLPVTALGAAARAHRYYVPVQAFYTLRMQSNPYLQWARK